MSFNIKFTSILFISFLIIFSEEAFGQTTACLDGECYPSLAAAESALRSDPIYGPYFTRVSTGQTLVSGDSGSVVITYKVPDRPPSHLMDPGYGNGSYTAEQLGCAPSETDPVLCADESEMLALVVPRIRELFIAGNCALQNEGVVGNYAQPFREVMSENSATRTGVLMFHTNDGSVEKERRWHYEANCPGWGQDYFDSYNQPLVKIQRFTCPEGYYSYSGTASQYADASQTPVAWPNVCQPAMRSKLITVSISQVRSVCTANPCHPTTGDKSRQEQDFMFAGHPFIRNYHSLGEAQGNSGAASGWLHTYEERLELAGSSPVLITSSGYIEGFSSIDEDSSLYRAANSSDRLLRRYADGHYSLMDGAGVFKDFDVEGRLSRIEYRDGVSESIDMVYLNGLLAAAIDSKGRGLLFSYTDGLLSRIDQPDGQYVGYQYDIDRNLIAVDYSGQSKKQYLYHESGLASGEQKNALTGIVQEDGTRYGSFSYDASGRVISSVLNNSSGAVDGVALNYISSALVSVTQPLGGMTDFSIEPGLYRRVLGISSDQGEMSNTYYDDGRIKTHTDMRGIVTSYEYQPGYRSAIITAAGTAQQRREEEVWDTSINRPLQRLTYDAAGTLSSKVVWTYNTRGQVLTEVHTDPVSAVSRTSKTDYCEDADVTAGSCPLLGLLKAVDGPRTDVGDTASYAYYPSDDAACATTPAACPHRKGDLWKITNALGQVTEYLSYDGAGRVLSIKDANGTVTDYTYHPRGWLTASKVRGADTASDRITLIDYWPTGLVKQVTQPDGAFTAFTYDAAHRLTDVADNAGNTLHYTLDNAGNRVKEDTKDASGTLKRTLSRVYNQLGQLATQATASGDPTDFGYDANGNTTGVTDALGHKTQNDYDPLNHLARTLQDVGGIAAETKFGYDALDNLTKVTDPKGLDTTYAYNGLGDLTKLTSPDTGVTTYTYDSAGNRATQTDARNIKTTYSYDALNRLTKVAYPTTSLNVSYTYDVSQTTCASGETYAIGRLARMQDSSGSTDYCYDRFGDLVRKVQTTNGKVFVLRYAYTKAGQLSRLTYPDGAAVDYVRNAQGQTTEVGVTPAGGTRQVLLGNATYYPFGPVASWSYGNGRPMQRVLDQDYRPLAVSDTRSDGLSTGFAFDPAGNLSALTAAGNTAPVVSLDYDALGRLTAFKDGPTGTVIDGYSYDATGNRLSAKVNTTTQSYTYPTTNHRLSAVAGTARTYDAIGNTLSIGGAAQEFAYDATGRMSQAKRAGTVVMKYGYNGRGEQVRRVDKTNTYTLYDESGHWLGNYDANGASLQQAIWLDDLPVGVLAKNSLRYVQPDHLGSPRAVIDPVRDVAIWTWDLKGEAFGNTPPDQDPEKDGVAFVFDMRFPGQRYDAATGLNQNYFRDYDPGTGRYGQSDPINLASDISTYRYSESSPLIYFDKFGLSGKSVLEELFPMPWDPRRCAEILALISKKRREIELKFSELDRNKYSLPNAVGGGLREDRMGHITKINELDSQARWLEDQYDRHCRGPNQECPVADIVPAQNPKESETTGSLMAPVAAVGLILLFMLSAVTGAGS